MNNRILQLLKKRIIILDGATGTQLQDRGMGQGACPEGWCIKNPEILSRVHKAYSDAGADIIYTCTFGANRLKLSQYGINDVFGVNKKLAGIARKSVASKVLIAGDIGPTGSFVTPFGNLSFEEAVNIFKEQIKGLLAGGVDLLAIETMMDIQEARAALIAVKEMTKVFTLVTMTYDSSRQTLNGTDPLSALITLQSLGADAVGCNCSTGPKDMKKIISLMKPYAKVPLVAKPNAGMPRLIGKKTVFNMTPEKFASHCQSLADSGTNILGGCCGSTPEHIKCMKESLRGVRPLPVLRKSVAALSSSRKALLLEKKPSFLAVGEKINPTSKKKMQKELLSGKFSIVRSLVKEQELSGAAALDVNMGVPGADEKGLMCKAIELLSVITDLPLVIDSSDPGVIEAALRIYPGRALINSISGEKNKLKKLLPLAKKYGAMFILLPLSSKKIPLTFKERKLVIQKILPILKKNGFTKDDVVIDALVMTASYYPQSALQTCKTISWASNNLGYNTIIGISNISFGFPERKLINKTFLTMVKASGLSLAIINPQDNKTVRNSAAYKLLTAEDKGGAAFISKYSDIPNRVKSQSQQPDIPIKMRIYQAVLDGDRDSINELLKIALSESIRPFVLMQDILIPAIIEVGVLFDKKKYFLPQLIWSAQSMKKGIAYLEPLLKADEISKRKKGLIIIATVSGDIHDIGKNIVGLMLKNHGFEIIDLGKDISTARIITAIKRFKPDAVGLSALMTTTMVSMKDVVDAIGKDNLSCRVMVGGAVVNSNYANDLGAAYAKDGVEAVRVAEGLCLKKGGK